MSLPASLWKQDAKLETVQRAYHCARCSAFRQATVTAFGVGGGFFGTAARNASRDARRAVPMLLRLVPCPACGFRDEKLARKNVRTRRTVLAAMCVLWGAMLGVLAWGPGLVWFALGIAPFLTFFLVAQSRILAARYPSSAEGRVTLTDPPTELAPRAAGAIPTTAQGWLEAAMSVSEDPPP